MIDAYEGLNIESNPRGFTDDFGSPPSDAMMSPPLEPLESQNDISPSYIPVENSFAEKPSSNFLEVSKEPYRLNEEGSYHPYDIEERIDENPNVNS